MRRRAVQAWRPSGGLGHVLTLVTGATAAQALLLLSRPVLTRLYPAEAFGLLSVFVAPAYLLATVGTMRYEDAVTVPADDQDGAGLAALAGGAALATALLLALAVPFRQSLAAALGAPELAPLLPLVPAVVGLLGLANAAQAWLARADAYRAISFGAVVQSATVAGVQFGLAGDNTLDGLVWGTVLGALAFAAILVVAAVRSGVVGHVRASALGALAQRWRRFPQLGLPAAGLIQLAARLPPLILVAAYGTAVVGYFSVAMASVGVPVGLVGDSVSQVFVARGAQAHRDGRLGPLVERVHARMAAFAAFPVLAVAVFGPDLFAVVFGAPWREAGLYARVLSPWLLLATIGTPLTRAFDVTERQRDELATGAVTAVLIVGGLLLGARLGSPVQAMAALAAGGALARVVQIVWIFRLSGAQLSRGARDLLTSIASAAGWLVPGALLLAKWGLGAGLAGAAVGAVGYLATVLRRLPVDAAPDRQIEE